MIVAVFPTATILVMSESVDRHSLIAEIKDMAITLGRTPTRDEFVKEIRGGKDKISALFGSYAAFIHASGLEPVRVNRKITNEVFNRDIDQHLSKYTPRAQKQVEPYKRCLFIPDVHFPFGHQPTLEKIYRFAEKEQPDVIVQLGDLYDAYSHAKFAKSVNVFTPRDEQRAARMMAETMWKEVKAVAPKARCVQILGNHDLRPLKRILESFPSAEDWVEKMLHEAMSFEGVETVFDIREELRLPGDVACVHGFRSKIGEHRDSMMYNVVAGHLHVGGCLFRQIQGRVLWELNCGLAGDPESKGMSYTPSRITNWTLGWGWLDEYGPRFIAA